MNARCLGGELDTAQPLAELLTCQQAAQSAQGAPALALRLDRLQRLHALIVDNQIAICAAIAADFGTRSVTETTLLEIVPTLNAIVHARRHLRRWMRPRRRAVAWQFQPARAWVQHQPLGVVGIVAPWNYPLLLALSPLVDAFAAGNRALIKPSELTPAWSELLQRLVASQFEPAELAVVTGGPAVAQAFCALPFDHLVFTGSTGVGRQVMQAAAANLTPVTLELGGKSPAIVGAAYADDKAARSIAFGKFVNAGQTCIAPDYVLVPRARLDTLAQALMSRLRTCYPAVAGNDDYASIISPRHHQRLVNAVDEARARGARVLVHGDGGDAAARKVAPTLVIDPPLDILLMREEIFGPVLPLVPYDKLDDAIAFVNRNDRPLALYCLTNDAAERDAVLASTLSGGVTLNGTLLHLAQDALPFGGVGASGLGAYHGEDGFKRLSHARGVHQVGWFNGFELLAPPYGALAERARRWLAR